MLHSVQLVFYNMRAPFLALPQSIVDSQDIVFVKCNSKRSDTKNKNFDY